MNLFEKQGNRPKTVFDRKKTDWGCSFSDNLPLHDFHTSSFTYVTDCIIFSCGESSLYTIVFGTVTGNLLVSRHRCGNG